MTLEEVRNIIQAELRTALQAERAGNEGMARVCARRAAGAAVGFWLEEHPQRGWGVDAMSRLRNLALAPGVPLPVREAASRLTARVAPALAPSTPDDPLAHARRIVRYLLDGEAG
jgi:hypothetical protein